MKTLTLLKKKISTIPVMAGIFMFVFYACGETRTEKASWPKGNPEHPGWLDQWMTMRTNEQGVLPLEDMRQIRNEVMAQRQLKSGSPLTDVHELGPHTVGGRIRGLIIDQADSNHYLAGGISGGIWRSTDRGQSWFPADDFSQNLSVTWIEQNPFRPETLYYASGEPSGNSAGIPGDGIFRSVDGGQTWQQLPATDNNNFTYNWRIKCSPIDTHVLFVATSNKGLWRSDDGGDSFYQVYHNSNVSDIEITPDGKIWIGVHNTGVLVSTTGQSGSFTQAGTGLPTSNIRRVEMAFAPGDPQRGYVVFENQNGNDCYGFYATTDGGQTWEPKPNPNASLHFDFPWYCLALSVSPSNPDYVLLGSVSAGYSTNGGNNFTPMANSHADYHLFYFLDGNRFLTANDGGLYLYNRSNASTYYTSLNNGLNITQFYAGSYFPTGEDYVGGTQDNGTQHQWNQLPTGTRRVFGGDGAFCHINQQVPSTLYASSQNANLVRCDNLGSLTPTFYSILNELDSDGDHAVDDPVWFINPMEMNVQDGYQLYLVTRRRVWASYNGGHNWTAITNTYIDLYSIGLSHHDEPTIYVGSTGRIYRIDNGLTAFPGSEVNISADMPQSVSASFISCIAVCPQDRGTFYVTYSTYDQAPSVWKVENGLSSQPVWTSIHGDLPSLLPVNYIVVSPYTDDIMVIATDYGLYVTEDGGQHWELETRIPFVSIHQLRLREDGKLFVYTHGRGVWTAQIPLTGMQLEPVSPEEKIWYSPNPLMAGQNLHLQRSFTRLELGDMNGRTYAAINQPNNQIRIPAGMPSGLYTLRGFTENGQVLTGKLLIR